MSGQPANGSGLSTEKNVSLAGRVSVEKNCSTMLAGRVSTKKKVGQVSAKKKAGRVSQEMVLV